MLTRRGFLSTTAAAALAPLRAATEKAKPLNLKITDLKTIVVHIGGGNWVFAKVYTNQGLTGLGEGSITSKEATLSQAILEHHRFLVGKDPTDIELLWQGIYRYPRWRGGPILNSAISAVEIALWDILGKALGQPVYKLLGGAARRRVRLYKDVGSTVDAFLQAKAEGYTAAKSGFHSRRQQPRHSPLRRSRGGEAPRRGPPGRRRRLRYLHRRARQAHHDHGGRLLHAHRRPAAVLRRGTDSA
jgi:L-alanine-DL-glutamate epimerase-like enolase superfamily enzyme